MKNYAILFFAALIQNIGMAQEQNDSSTSDDFQVFKTKLSRSIIQKDTSLLSELLNDRVFECWEAFDCAGREGCLKKDFLRILFNDTSSKEWETMHRLMEIGFRMTPDTFHYPFLKKLRAAFGFVSPIYIKDTYQLYILTDSSIVHTKASATSEIQQSLPRGYYTYQKDEYGYPMVYNEHWLHLFLEDGTSGFIPIQYTSESINRELRVSKINGVWKIVAYECQLNL